MTGYPAAAVPGTLYSAVAGLPMMWLRRVFAGIFDLSSAIATWLRSHGSWV